MPRVYALDAIRSWPDQSREPADWILHVHGEADHVGASKLVWNEICPLDARRRQPVVRRTPGTDSTRRFAATEHRVSRARRQDRRARGTGWGPRIPSATGEVAAHGHDLQVNPLAVNLRDEVVNKAHRRYADEFVAAERGRPSAEVTEIHVGDDTTTGEPAHVATEEDLRGPRIQRRRGRGVAIRLISTTPTAERRGLHPRRAGAIGTGAMSSQ